MMNDCVNGHSEEVGGDISMQWLSAVFRVCRGSPSVLATDQRARMASGVA